MRTPGLALLFFVCALSARPLHVSSSGGSDQTGDGTLGKPYATIQKAADLTNPGDTVFVMAGTYTNSCAGCYVLHLTRSGTSSAWITYIAYPGDKPRISHNGWCGIKSESVSYVEINGFEISGNRDNIDLAYANANKGTAPTSGGGIEFDGRNQTSRPHHIRILNNTIRKCCGGGISMIQCDYVTIDNNVVYGNAWYSQWANSGISTYQNWRFDAETGYKMIITRNVCYDNRSLVNWVATGALSDGNGIIIDDSKHTQNGSTLGAYTGRTLVANNVSYNNGGSGIHSYSSEHVDIINNTTYANGQVVNYPCCYAADSRDANVLNNIIYAAPGKPTTANNGNVNVRYDYNIYYGGTAPAAPGTHDRTVDPLLVNATTDPATADFHLKSNSPCRNRGDATLAPPVDIAGTLRPQQDTVDIGAYEYVVTTSAVMVTGGRVDCGSQPAAIRTAIGPGGLRLMRADTPSAQYSILGRRVQCSVLP